MQLNTVVRLCLLSTFLSALISFPRFAAAEESPGGLWLEWEELESHGERSNTWLIIHGPTLSRPVRIHYLEAYVRPGSTDEDWLKSIFGHKTELLELSQDLKSLRLRDTLSNGVIVEHRITAGEDEVDFQLTAHNPTGRSSQAHWAQPCVRVGDFSGTGRDDTSDPYAYVQKSFLFLDGQLTRMPTKIWATRARYVPGQVWCPVEVPRTDVNPRPLNPQVPSNGLIGCFNEDESQVLAIAFEPYQELFQGVARCLHSDFRLGAIEPGESVEIRGKIYVVEADLTALLKRYRKDFPEHIKQPE